MGTIVYVFTNPAMPGLVKIGTVDEVGRIQSRKAELYYGASGVPFTFDCPCAVEIDDEEDWERRFHRLFAEARVNPRREFFRVPKDDLIPVLLKCGRDVTPPSPDTGNAKISLEEIEAGQHYGRRPPLRLINLGIQNGAVLVSRKAGVESEECEVVDAQKNTVRFRGEVQSFTEATRIILGDPQWVISPAHSTRFWEYNGQRLRDLYVEIYPREEED